MPQLPPELKREARNVEIRALRESGRSLRQIAEKVGLSDCTVYYILCPNKYDKQKRAEWAASEAGREYARKAAKKWRKSDAGRRYLTRPINRVKARLRRLAHEAKASGYVPCTASPKEVLKRFSNNCESCGGPCTLDTLVIDHCHLTGLFRGWICARCNSALGLLGDDIACVRNLLSYLERSSQTKLLDGVAKKQNILRGAT